MANLNQALGIDEALRAVRSKSVPEDELESYLDLMQDYECWQPLFGLVNQQLASNKRQISCYMRLSVIYAHHLEDIPKLAETCKSMVKALQLPYEEFRVMVLSKLIQDEDFEKEAVILEAIKEVLQDKLDRIVCLERLCLIYEKKKYDDFRMNSSYEALIQLDSANLKALRYFKTVHTQNEEWRKVASVLQQLYEATSHVNDRYRLAQELATIYLLQLNMPKEALDILETYCKGSPLDISSLAYEANYQLENWKNCLDILNAGLLKVESNEDRAVILLKIGMLWEFLENDDQAQEAFKLSHKENPKLFESLEQIIKFHVANRNWKDVIKYLVRMKDLLDDDFHLEGIEVAIARINSALDTE